METPVGSMPKPTACLLILAAAALIACPAGCSRNRSNADATIEEAPGAAVREVHAAGERPQRIQATHQGLPRTRTGQLPLDHGAVLGDPPPAAPMRPSEAPNWFSTCAIPEPVIQKLKSMKLSASVDGVALPEETYTKAGAYVYSRDVPAQALVKRVVTVSFTLDKCLPPSDCGPAGVGRGGDGRRILKTNEACRAGGVLDRPQPDLPVDLLVRAADLVPTGRLRLAAPR